MHKSYKLLGVDLGGCMSGNAAYIYAEVHGQKIEVIETIKEPKHKDHLSCQTFIVDLFERLEIDAIAIDAPLSLPRPLCEPSFTPPPREGRGEIINPYLFRYTDYYLFKTFGLRPMPPAGDRIGRLTARAVALLHHFDYQAPHIMVKGRKIPIYEVYPKQIAQHLEIADYKKRPEVVKKYFHVDADLDEHLVDALLCCHGAAKILKGETIAPVTEAGDEGWCYPIV